MKLTPAQIIAQLPAQMEANLSMLAFAMTRASDAMAEFAFAWARAERSDGAKRAREIAYAALARARITAPPFP